MKKSGYYQPLTAQQAVIGFIVKKLSNDLNSFTMPVLSAFHWHKFKLCSNLHDNPKRTRCEVKALTAQHIQELQQKINQLESMKTTLQTWHDLCEGDEKPDCPILKGLERD